MSIQRVVERRDRQSHRKEVRVDKGLSRKIVKIFLVRERVQQCQMSERWLKRWMQENIGLAMGKSWVTLVMAWQRGRGEEGRLQGIGQGTGSEGGWPVLRTFSRNQTEWMRTRKTITRGWPIFFNLLYVGFRDSSQTDERVQSEWESGSTISEAEAFGMVVTKVGDGRDHGGSASAFFNIHPSEVKSGLESPPASSLLLLLISF